MDSISKFPDLKLLDNKLIAIGCKPSIPMFLLGFWVKKVLENNEIAIKSAFCTQFSSDL